jgi:hypothetical protein
MAVDDAQRIAVITGAGSRIGGVLDGRRNHIACGQIEALHLRASEQATRAE